MSKSQIDEPLNANERYLYGINMRLEVLIEQMSSLLEHIAKKEGVAVESAKVVEKPAPRRKKPVKE